MRPARRIQGAALALLLAASGCSSGPKASPDPSPAGHAETPPPPAPAPDLRGLWVEFWAVSGSADTQRYAFFEDGRFGWTASSSAAAPVARRWGRFEVAGGEVVLSVEGYDERFGCEASTACRVTHPQAIVERLALGECPDNEEARALDRGYRCVSLGGQAFWRDASAAADPKIFLP